MYKENNFFVTKIVVYKRGCFIISEYLQTPWFKFNVKNSNENI